jgi:uncharacterized protein YndB with AHSA1/START domain
MKDKLLTKVSITIDASTAQVWKAITTPEIVKKYLFGTTVSTDWKEGSPITYSGEYNGKEYHDKGIIKKVEPEKILQSTYWSSMSGVPDKPENYKLVTYSLSKKDFKTILTLTQDNNANEEEKQHTTENWNMVLKKLKEIVERESE